MKSQQKQNTNQSKKNKDLIPPTIKDILESHKKSIEDLAEHEKTLLAKPNEIQKKHNEDNKGLTPDGKYLRECLKEDYEQTVRIGTFYREWRIKLLTFFTSISFTITGFSLIQSKGITRIICISLAFLLYLVAVSYFYRHRKTSEEVKKYLLKLDMLLGYKGPETVLNEMDKVPFYERLRFLLKCVAFIYAALIILLAVDIFIPFLK